MSAGINWHPYPMVRLLLPLAAGIWWGSMLSMAPAAASLLLSLFLLSLWGFAPFQRGQAVFGMVFTVWLFLAGWSYVHLRDPLQSPHHWLRTDSPEARHWTGTVASVRTSEKWWRLTLELSSRSAPEQDGQSVSGRLLLYLPREEAPFRIGDVLAFEGLPSPIPPALDPLGFSWRDYQRVRGVTHQLFLRQGQWERLPTSGAQIAAFFHASQQRFGKVLDQALSDPQARQLARAVILGDREEFSDALNEAYQASGAVHVLAVSGLHVGLVAGMVMGLLGLFLRSRRSLPVKALLAVGLVWGFVGLTGAADSAVRAGVLFSVVLLGKSLRRHASGLNLLAAAVVFLLLYQPWIIHHVGFQLSVLAVAGILFFQPLLERLWHPPHRWSAYFWSLFTVTLAAQAATLMLSLFYFHRFPVYFVLSGLFVVPLAGLFLGAGVATLVLHSLAPPLADWTAVALESVARLMNALVLGIADLPGSTLTDLHPHAFWIGVLPLVLGALLFALVRREGRALVIGVALVAIALSAEAALYLARDHRWDWQVIRRQNEGTRILVGQGRDWISLLPASATDTVPVQAVWPGLGKVWEMPARVDFTYGRVAKSGQQLFIGPDTLSWGKGPVGHYHLLLPGESIPQVWPPVCTLLLAPDLAWKERRNAQQRVPVHITRVDLREEGYWQRRLAGPLPTSLFR